MVNIDTVYQKVLALASKEQRGYITPQQFDLLADKAQMEIINNYFHKLKMARLKPSNSSEGYDTEAMILEKLACIRVRVNSHAIVENSDLQNNSSVNSVDLQLPSNLYKLASIFTLNTYNTDGSINYENGREIVEVDLPRLLLMNSNPLTRPTASRPVYYQREVFYGNSYNQSSVANTAGNLNSQSIKLEIHPADIISETGITKVRLEYWQKPPSPHWAYVVVNQKPLNNNQTSKNFVLNSSEEEELVNRIITLCGVSLGKQDLLQYGMISNANATKEQNS